MKTSMINIGAYTLGPHLKVSAKSQRYLKHKKPDKHPPPLVLRHSIHRKQGIGDFHLTKGPN